MPRLFHAAAYVGIELDRLLPALRGLFPEVLVARRRCRSRPAPWRRRARSASDRRRTAPVHAAATTSQSELRMWAPALNYNAVTGRRRTPKFVSPPKLGRAQRLAAGFCDRVARDGLQISATVRRLLRPHLRRFRGGTPHCSRTGPCSGPIPRSTLSVETLVAVSFLGRHSTPAAARVANELLASLTGAHADRLLERGRGAAVRCRQASAEPRSGRRASRHVRRSRPPPRPASPCVGILDPAYPPLLRQIADPPPFLWVRGDMRRSWRRRRWPSSGRERATPTGTALGYDAGSRSRRRRTRRRQRTGAGHRRRGPSRRARRRQADRRRPGQRRRT